MISESFRFKKEKPDPLAQLRQEIQTELEAEYAKGKNPLAELAVGSEPGSESKPDIPKLISELQEADLIFWRDIQRGDVTKDSLTRYTPTLKGASQARRLFSQFAMNQAQVAILHKAEMDKLDAEARKRAEPLPDDFDQTIERKI